MALYGTFDAELELRQKRFSKVTRVSVALGLLAATAVVGVYYNLETGSSNLRDSVNQLHMGKVVCPSWPTYCVEGPSVGMSENLHDTDCLDKFHGGDPDAPVDSGMCLDYVADCEEYCNTCQCTEPSQQYCSSFLEPCFQAAKYISDVGSTTCVKIISRAEKGQEGCGSSCGTVQTKDGLHTFARWDESLNGNPRGFGVVEFDADTLQEVNQVFFYFKPVSAVCANEGGTCECTGDVKYGKGSTWVQLPSVGGISCSSGMFGDPLPHVVKECICLSNSDTQRNDISDMAVYLSAIPAGRPVAITTVHNPIAEYNAYASDINTAMESMGIKGPPSNGGWHGAFTAFGKAGCRETVSCPSWVSSDYQKHDGEESSSEANICVAKGNNVDVFGCYTKAGYSWCATLNACVQNWEGGHGGPCPSLGLPTDCAHFEARGEGCQHSDKCGGCGCATVVKTELAQTDFTGIEGKDRRGMTIAVINPNTFAIEVDTFFQFTDMAGLTTYLTEIEAGKIVALMTSDEPFQSWRGEAQTAVNAALRSMGVPPPPNNPEYRGAFAGFGLAGCSAAASCPAWADSQYTGRYGNSAVLETEICIGNPVISTTQGGCMVDETPSSGGVVWCDRSSYTFELSPELTVDGAVQFQGPHRIPSGDVLSFTSGNPGTYWALLSQGDAGLRAGSYVETLTAAGWVKSETVTAAWMFGSSPQTFDVYSIESGGAAITLPAATGGDTVASFLWTPGCIKTDADTLYTAPFFTAEAVADAAACAVLCEEESNCHAYSYGKTEGEASYQQCKFFTTLPTDATKITDVNFDSGIVGCGPRHCMTLRAAGEGCSHEDKTAGCVCGCATLRLVDLVGGALSHKHQGRGISVLNIDPITLALIEQTVIPHTQLEQLAIKLKSIPHGHIVAVATSDEPFDHWRGEREAAVNNVLLSMGIPPPPINPEYRGAFAGFGLAGCKSTDSCPQWATSEYTGRYSSSAKVAVDICPLAVKGSCEPTGTYQPNECCPAGYGSITDSRTCEGFADLAFLDGYTFDGASVAFDTSAQRPTGCFFDAATSKLHYNRHNVASQGQLVGGDAVVCKRQNMVAPKYTAGGYTFNNANPSCGFKTVGTNFFQRQDNYPSCPPGYKSLAEATEDGGPADGFCCKGECMSSPTEVYVFDSGDEICATSDAGEDQLFGETMAACTAEPATNKYCQWALGSPEGTSDLTAWDDYVVRARLSFKGKSAGITVRVQDPHDEMSQRYWFKFQTASSGKKTDDDSDEVTTSLVMTYFDGISESVVQPEQLVMIAPVVRLQTAPVLSKPEEADLISAVDEAVVDYGVIWRGQPARKPDRWTSAVKLDAAGTAVATDIGADEFNNMFQACPIVRYTRGGAVIAIYKRINLNTLAEINGYDLFTNTWTQQNNRLSVDFNLFSSEGDMLSDTGRWSYCNYDDPDVGFPRDCGLSGGNGGRWFSMPGGIHNNPSGGAGFDVYTAADCPVALASSCADAACNGADSTLAGTGEYCTAGWSCCDTSAPVDNAGCTEAPCWSRGDTCPAPSHTDPAGWEDAVVTTGGWGRTVATDIGKEDFNAKFAACPVVRYTTRGSVYAVYKRIGGAYTNAYDLFTYTWSSGNNLLNTDFELYDNEADMRNGEGKWQFCNYNDPDVGFPRDCGKNGGGHGGWFSMPGGRHRSADSTFSLYTGSKCPVGAAEPDSWTTAVELGGLGTTVATDIGQAEFNRMFDACPVVKYTYRDVVSAVYKRTNTRVQVDAYNLMTHTWSSHNNALNVDFELYDNEADMRNGAGRWQFCNYNDPDVGFPRDCSKSADGRREGYSWFSMPGWKHTMNNASPKFELYTGTNCPIARQPKSFCSIRNPNLGDYSNSKGESHCEFGMDSRIGFKITAEFPVTTKGNYGFRFRVDFGWGGVVLMDGKEMGDGYYEKWPRGTPRELNVNLDVGMHSLALYGAEDGNDGVSAISFRKPGSDNWVFLTETNLHLAAADYADYKGAVKTSMMEDTVYRVEVRAVDDSFAVLVDDAEYATFKHEALRSGSIGLQTWQASMAVSTLEFLREWVSDERTTHCTRMAVQPTLVPDSDESPLEASAAQQICDAFRDDGCAGFLFTSRAAQHDLDGTNVASASFCSGDMTRSEGEASNTDPVGWFRPASL